MADDPATPAPLAGWGGAAERRARKVIHKSMILTQVYEP